MNPQLSIIIPVYNLGESLHNSLDSISRHAFNSSSLFEIVIINDGSTDDSVKIIKKFISKSKTFNIKFLSTDNKGVHEARNLGISKSSGRFLLFLDGDDSLTEGFNEFINNIKNVSENIEFIIFKFFYKNQNKKKPSKFEINPGDDNNLVSAKNVIELIASKKLWVWTSSIVFNREFIIRKGQMYKNYKTGQDILFNHENLMLAESGKIHNIFVTNYVYRKNSVSNVFQASTIDAFFVFKILYFKSIHLNKRVSKFYRNQMQSHYLSIRYYYFKNKKHTFFDHTLLKANYEKMSIEAENIFCLKKVDKFDIRSISYCIVYRIKVLYLFAKVIKII